MQSALARFPQLMTIAYNLALLGATDVQMANALDVSVKTIEYWKRTNAEFRESLLRGKLIADSEVAASLLKCALGFDYQEDQVVTFHGETQTVKITRHRPANPWAAYKWLSLRNRDHWHDTQTVDITSKKITANLNIDLSDISTDELTLLKRVIQNNPISGVADEPEPIDNE